MSIFGKAAGAHREIDTSYVNVGGVWKEVASAFSNVAGTWKELQTVIDLTISSDFTGTYNIASQALAAGWNGTSPVEVNVTINSNIVVSGTVAGDSGYALRTGEFPEGSVITIINNGYIIGRGGDGGDGGTQSDVAGDPGSKGGTAVFAESPLIIVNNGTIAGGGGGGGGGRAFHNTIGVDEWLGGGGGGGGQSGRDNSSGGAGGVTNGDDGSAGGDGTFSARGGAGGGGDGGFGEGGDGGLGGTWGNAGGTGGGSGSPGGAAGRYINGNSLVTWATEGTRLGGVA